VKRLSWVLIAALLTACSASSDDSASSTFGAAEVCFETCATIDGAPFTVAQVKQCQEATDAIRFEALIPGVGTDDAFAALRTGLVSAVRADAKRVTRLAVPTAAEVEWAWFTKLLREDVARLARPTDEATFGTMMRALDDTYGRVAGKCGDVITWSWQHSPEP
jgi:hypothetical protein